MLQVYTRRGGGKRREREDGDEEEQVRGMRWKARTIARAFDDGGNTKGGWDEDDRYVFMHIRMTTNVTNKKQH